MRAWELIEKHGVRSVEQLKARPALASEIWGDLGRSGKSLGPLGLNPHWTRYSGGAVLGAPLAGHQGGDQALPRTLRGAQHALLAARGRAARGACRRARAAGAPAAARPRHGILPLELEDASCYPNWRSRGHVFSCIQPYSQLYSLASASLVFTRCSDAVNTPTTIPWHGRHAQPFEGGLVRAATVGVLHHVGSYRRGEQYCDDVDLVLWIEPAAAGAPALGMGPDPNPRSSAESSSAESESSDPLSRDDYTRVIELLLPVLKATLPRQLPLSATHEAVPSLALPARRLARALAPGCLTLRPPRLAVPQITASLSPVTNHSLSVTNARLHKGVGLPRALSPYLPLSPPISPSLPRHRATSCTS